MKKRFPFRQCLQILILAVFFGLGAAILLPLWQAVSAGMAVVRDDLIVRLEKELDREIRYTSISPSIFGAFDIRNVSVTGNGEAPILTVSRFRVAYSFPDLLFRRTLNIRSVILDAPVIDLNMARDDDILSLLDSLLSADWLNGDSRAIDVVFPGELTVQVRGGTFIVSGGDDRLQIDTFNLNSGINGSLLSLDGRWNVSVMATPPIGEPIGLQLEMRVSGSGCVDSREGDGFFTIPYITGDVLSISPVIFSIALRDGLLGMRKVPDRFPFDMSVEYSFTDGSMGANIDAWNFRLGDLLSLSGGLGSFRQLLDVELSGRASLQRGQDGGLAYVVNLAGSSADGSPRGMGDSLFEINASGDENGVEVRTLRLSLPETDDPAASFFGSIAFAGSASFDSFAINGALSLDGFSVARMRDLNTEIAIKTKGYEISLTTEALRVGGTGTATLGATLRQGGAFEAFVLWPTNGRAGSVLLHGSMSPDPRRIDATVRVDSFPVRDIAEMVMPRGSYLPMPVNAFLGSDTVVSTEVFLSTDFTRLWYNAPAIVFSGGTLGGTISLSGTESRIEFGESNLVWGDESLLFSGNAEFDASEAETQRNVNFYLNAGYRGLGYFVEGTFNGNSILISGSNGLDINLAHQGDGEYSGHIYADNFPIPFLGHPALLSVNAHLDFDVSGLWSVGLERLEVSNMVGPAGLTRVLASGHVNEHGAVFPVLFYEDAVGPLSGSADFHWFEDRSGVAGRFLIDHGAEAYRAEGTFADGVLDLVLSGSNMRLYRFSRNFRHTVASGDLRLELDPSDIDSINAELDLFSIRGRAGGGEFTASVRVGLDSEQFTLNDMRLNFADLEASVPALTLSRSEGAAHARMEFGGVVGRRPVEGAVLLDAGFASLGSWLEMAYVLDSFSGRARVRGLRYGEGAQAQDFDFVFSRDGSAIAVSGGPRNMLRFQMDHNANFFLALSSPFPVRGSVIGTIRDNKINARCNDLFIDLAGLFAILPVMDDFFISDGYVTASIDIRGPLRDPEFYGQARGTGVRIHIPQVIPVELRPVPFTIVFDGDEIRFGPVPTAVGNGAGTVSALFNFERWIPDTFSINILVPRESPIPFDMNLTGFMASGDVAGRFNVSMEGRSFIHSGDLWANNALLGVDTDEIGHGREPFYRLRIPMMANVTVTTGPVAEFLYPTVRFPIVRATPEMGTRIYVTADSIARQFSVTGDVRIRGGEIFYFQRSFYIRSGLLTFRENEHGFDPTITARAEVRDRNENGPVTLSMIVDNAPLTSFTARFESSPPLSQVEIFTMLGQNIAGPGMHGDGDVDPMRAFLVTTSDLLAQFTVVRAVEQYIRNFTRLDMFSIRTQVLQNALFSMTGFTQPHVDINGRLGNYLDNTTIFGGKYIGQNMFVQGMLSMRHDANRAAFGGLVLQPDIGFDFQGPMINDYNLRIRWDFVPTSPENWFVNDNSITLTLSRLF